MANVPYLGFLTVIGRTVDQAVCAGSLANAARSVSQDQVRADQRRDAQAAVEELERTFQRRRAARRRRTG